jgi:tetratricopeptide (TPR) repeat protein
LAGLWEAKNDREKALNLYMESLDIKEVTIGTQCESYAVSCTDVGDVYKLTGKVEEALDCYVIALKILEDTVGKEHESYKTSKKSLETILYDVPNQYVVDEKLIDFVDAKLEYEMYLSEKEMILGLERGSVNTMTFITQHDKLKSISPEWLMKGAVKNKNEEAKKILLDKLKTMPKVFKTSECLAFVVSCKETELVKELLKENVMPTEAAIKIAVDSECEEITKLLEKTKKEREAKAKNSFIETLPPVKSNKGGSKKKKGNKKKK